MNSRVILSVRVAYAVMALCFLWFASLQFNDVDAQYWIAVYGAAALSCLGVTFLGRYRMHGSLTIVFSILLVVWMATLVPDIEGKWWDGEVEREFGGLAIVLVTQLGKIFFFRRMSRS